MWAGHDWTQTIDSLVRRERVADSGPARVDTKRHRYPFAIVWTPIPPITWVLPFVGHMGVCDSRGVIYDFTGLIGIDDLAFGKPTRYLVLNPKHARCVSVPFPSEEKSSSLLAALAEEAEGEQEESVVWDRAVLRASQIFERRMHCMVCGSDCHSHVAVALNLMKFGGCSWWNKVVLAAWMFFCGKYVDKWAVVKTWLGTAIVLVIVLLVQFS